MKQDAGTADEITTRARELSQLVRDWQPGEYSASYRARASLGLLRQDLDCLLDETETPRPVIQRRCRCGCGALVNGSRAQYACGACRVRAYRQRQAFDLDP